LPSASVPFVIGTSSVHRNPPHVRDDRETPLMMRRDGREYAGDLVREKTKIFLAKGLDTKSVICPSGTIR
jgi:hypothetical protein